MDETSVRGLLEAAIGDEPPIGPVARNSLLAGLKLRRRTRIRRATGGAAVVVALAAVLPAAIGTLGNSPATRHHAARHHAPRPPGPWVPPSGTAYVMNSGGGTVTPIDLATSTAEKPIDVSGEPVAMTLAPDKKTAYVSTGFTNSRASTQGVQPIDLATNTAGKPIDLQWPPDAIVITPDGKTAYASNGFPSLTLTPINLVTDTPGKPIRLSEWQQAIAMAPDGKTYVAIQITTGTPAHSRTVHEFMSLDLATGRFGKPVKLSGQPETIAITPNGKTAYVTMFSTKTVIPINLSANKAGRPIKISGKSPGHNFMGLPYAIAIAPNGKTAYVTNGASGTVTPIDLATGKPGKPIKINGKPGSDAIAISADGTTAYVANQPSSTVTPIYLATGTPEKPIKIGHGWDSGFEAIVITP
jgi:DNA-binding beta-propeller fold protein YncE